MSFCNSCQESVFTLTRAELPWEAFNDEPYFHQMQQRAHILHLPKSEQILPQAGGRCVIF